MHNYAIWTLRVIACNKREFDCKILLYETIYCSITVLVLIQYFIAISGEKIKIISYTPRYTQCTYMQRFSSYFAVTFTHNNDFLKKGGWGGGLQLAKMFQLNSSHIKPFIDYLYAVLNTFWLFYCSFQLFSCDQYIEKSGLKIFAFFLDKFKLTIKVPHPGWQIKKTTPK